MDIKQLHNTIYEIVGREWAAEHLGLLNERLNLFVNAGIDMVVTASISEYRNAVDVSLRNAALDRVSSLIHRQVLTTEPALTNLTTINLRTKGVHYTSGFGSVKKGLYVVGESGAILKSNVIELIPGTNYYSTTEIPGMNVNTGQSFTYYGQKIDLTTTAVYEMLKPGTILDLKQEAELFFGTLYLKESTTTDLPCLLVLSAFDKENLQCAGFTKSYSIVSNNLYPTIGSNPFIKEYAVEQSDRLIFSDSPTSVEVTYIRKPAVTNFPTDVYPIQVDCDLPDRTIPLVINSVINLIKPNNEKR